MEKLTKVATIALPIAVKEFDDGEYGWEIGPRGLLAWDVGCRSFDEAEGAARAAAEQLEKDMLERYTDAGSTIATQAPTPAQVMALLDVLTGAMDSMGNLRVNDFADGNSFAVEGSSLQNRRDALAPFTPTPPQTEPDPITPDGLADVLLLIDEEYPLEVITGWTQEQRDQVADWAGAVILEANDNDVKAPPKPDFLTR